MVFQDPLTSFVRSIGSAEIIATCAAQRFDAKLSNCFLAVPSNGGDRLKLKFQANLESTGQDSENRRLGGMVLRTYRRKLRRVV
jgi:hypothetical protein